MPLDAVRVNSSRGCGARGVGDISAADIYGLWLIEELRRHGYALSPGTLYPIVRNLAQGGYLRVERVVDGRVRKHYGLE
jgi:DNA-binding PadR family transcriptional regulator